MRPAEDDQLETNEPVWAYARELADGADRRTIRAPGPKRGVVEVFYAADASPTEDGPFLQEEARLLETVAKELTLMFERKMAEDEEAKMLIQLRHADRLATIGQRSAEVAHEINEPLSSILGFAQLIQKNPSLPEQALEDLRKIEKATLQARAVIRNLLLFARQVPTPKGPIELNSVVRDALALLQARLDGHEVELELEPALPPILGDSTQSPSSRRQPRHQRGPSDAPRRSTRGANARRRGMRSPDGRGYGNRHG